MREILFRGKGKRDGKWFFGSLSIESGEMDRNGNQSQDYRILGLRGECDYVIPDTVGQFTGLTDKNGTRIFEGDAVLYKGDERGVVTYDEETARFCVAFDTWSTDFDHLYGKELEVAT